MIRVGIIGAGFIGRMHFNNYLRQTDAAEVVALCDKDAARRMGDFKEVSGNLDTGDDMSVSTELRGYEDYRELIADPEVDLVDICVPTFMHKDIALAALVAGKHVLCEKPMACSVQECDEMLAAADAAPGTFMIAQCVRFWPEYDYLKQVLTDQRYGALKSLHLRRQASTPNYSMDNWLINADLSGGMILDLHVHDVDFIYYLLGRPQSISVQGNFKQERSVERIYAYWQYQERIPILLEGFWDMPASFGFNMGFSALFERAAIEWDLNREQPLTVYTYDHESKIIPELSGDDGYYNEIEYFLDCIAADKKPAVTTPLQSREAVAIALAERQAVLTGRPVDLSELKD